MFEFVKRVFRRRPGRRRLLILNPTSGHGKALQTFDRVQAVLREVLGDYEIHFTRGPGDATNRVRAALKDRAHRQIVVAGGDGTIHEAMNGYFDKGKSLSLDIPLGVINLGTGGDFYKTIRSMSPDYAASLYRNQFRLVDCGEAIMRPMGFTRYFINIASAGIAGEVLRNLKASSFQRGQAAFFYHTVRTFAKYEPARVRVTFTDVEGNFHDFEERIVNVFICNGKFNGGGMKWAPYGNLEDGAFQLVVVKRASKLRMVLEARKVYKGDLESMQGVSQWETAQVTLQPVDNVSVELDGEIPPIDSPRSIEFRVMPQALPIVL